MRAELARVQEKGSYLKEEVTEEDMRKGAEAMAGVAG